MLHFREHVPRSWPRRVRPAGKGDASAASSGARRPPGWSCAVKTVSCFPCPGTGRTFPCPFRRPLMRLGARARSFSPHRPWSSWFDLCGIMQTGSDLPGWERKEGMMIRVLAQIVVRQVCAPTGRILDEADPPPTRCPYVGQPACVPGTDPCVPAATRGAAVVDAGRWPQPQAQALVVLFTQLAQRHVQAARAQEEGDP